MTESDQERAFVSAASDHGAGIERGSSRKANAAYDRLESATKELRRLPDRGITVLQGLLAHADPSVRLAAATYLLPLDERPAMRALRDLEKEGRFLGLIAETTLEEWTAGRLQLP